MSAEARELIPQAAALEAQANDDAFVALQAAQGHTDNPHMIQLVGNRSGLLRFAAALLRQAAKPAEPITIEAVTQAQPFPFVDQEHSVVELVAIVHQETPPHEEPAVRKSLRDRILQGLFVLAISYFAIAGIVGGVYGLWWAAEHLLN